MLLEKKPILSINGQKKSWPQSIPKWNFHKIVIGKNGKVVDTFASFTKPSSNKFLTLINKEIKN